MQIALRPYVSASVAMIGAGLVAVTPVVVTPDTAQRAVQLASVDVLGDLEGMLSTLSSDIQTDIGQDTQSVGAILGGLIDPDLAGAPVQAADSAAVSDLGTGFTTALSDATGAGLAANTSINDAEGDIARVPNDFPDAESSDADAAMNATNAVNDLTTAEADADLALAALSAADPVQVFLADLQTDWTDLASGQGLSSTLLEDLIATLNAAPAAAQEAIALAIDPAAAGQVTVYEDATMAAEAIATAQQQYEAAATAAADAAGVSISDPITAMEAGSIVTDTNDAASAVSAALSSSADSTTSATDAINAVGELNPPDVSSELDALGSAVLTQLDALGSTVWTDLQTLGTDILGLF